MSWFVATVTRLLGLNTIERFSQAFPEDVELTILSFCDIGTVMSFSYCSREKYSVIHNSDWFWEQRAKALKKYDASVHIENWKKEYIELYKTCIDLSYNHPECVAHYDVNFSNASRVIKNTENTWERFLSKGTIPPHSLAQIEFYINVHDETAVCNAYRICVGAAEKREWKFEKKLYHESATGNYGFCITGDSTLIVNSSSMSLTNVYFKTGDTVRFTFDNGFTHKDKVIVFVFHNDIDCGQLEPNVNNPLTVGYYKASMSLCPSHEVTITRCSVLESK
jgi:hypothetical protein